MTTQQDPPGGDRLYRFLFEGLDLRGECVRLDAGWRAVLARNDYPAPVAAQLGQGLAAAVLLSATIKFEGSLILQVQGDGAIPTLIAQATHEGTFRGIARWHDDREIDPAAPFGTGSLAITIAPREGQRVQGVVGLLPGGLAAALEAYFARSEQLPTRLWLAADGQRAGGLLLQALPGEGTAGITGIGWPPWRLP
jgi:molecular chaperone Hsp33